MCAVGQALGPGVLLRRATSTPTSRVLFGTALLLAAVGLSDNMEAVQLHSLSLGADGVRASCGVLGALGGEEALACVGKVNCIFISQSKCAAASIGFTGWDTEGRLSAAR